MVSEEECTFSSMVDTGWMGLGEGEWGYMLKVSLSCFVFHPFVVTNYIIL